MTVYLAGVTAASAFLGGASLAVAQDRPVDAVSAITGQIGWLVSDPFGIVR